MHSFVYRLNTLVTFSVLLLGVLCAGASILDSFNSHSVRAHVEVLKVNRFRRQLNGNDEVALTLNISVDLQSAFTWNTKQVFVFVAVEYETPKNALNQISLWDHIIPDKEHAKFETQVTNKYLLIDQASFLRIPFCIKNLIIWNMKEHGSNLRGKKIELVLHWHVMPKTGRMIQDKIGVSSFQIPEAYT
ncbi:hypothetical protein Taro_037534 [Colocasia esculenta]|uniref:Signal peptidase complex subunit 3 n=1 Tax=Colocasia esculenta TaxID=4460 RepID=A0A843WA09_COLES|nr:hypothetical protein [Colocasia esculenta]